MTRDTRHTVALVLLLLALSMGATAACRAHRIDSCRDGGGTPVIPAWFTDEPQDVRCLQP